jgi:hypothetical protein
MGLGAVSGPGWGGYEGEGRKTRVRPCGANGGALWKGRGEW